MTFNEVKSRIQTVLVTMDKLSAAGAMELKGLGAVQEMAGCAAILSEISKLERVDDEKETKKAFK